MASQNSTQWAKVAGLVAGTLYSPLKPNEYRGRVRMAYFTCTLAANAVDDTINLVRVPEGGRIIGGHVVFSALSSGGGTAQIQVGTAADPDRYLGTTSVEAAGSSAIANTIALNYGEEVSEDTDVIATVKGEALATAGTLSGHVLFVVD